MFAAWWQRVGIAYVVLYCLPGPAELIPSLELVFEAAERWLVVLAGHWLFGVTLTIFPRGSGDTSYNYVEIVVRARPRRADGHGMARRRPGPRRVDPGMRYHFTILVRDAPRW